MKLRLFIIFLLIVIAGNELAFSQSRGKFRRKRESKQVELVESDSTSNYVVHLTLSHYYPYCGGMAPDESEMNNYSILSNTKLMFFDLTTGEKKIVKADSTGTLHLNLPKGKYGLKQMYKDCTFDEFLEKYYVTSSLYVESGDTACYKNWWSSYCIELDLTGTTHEFFINRSFSDRCFTGNNPCMMYHGPYPP